MRQIRAEIEIAASPDRVWQILTDFDSFPEWNLFMHRAEGQLIAGQRLKVYIQPPDGMGMTFKPTVLKAEQDQELRWLGRLLMPGLFDGEHYFLIEPQEERGSRFVQGEKFTGVLVPLFGLTPNPPKDTDGRREDSGRGWVRELQGRWPGVLG